MNTAQAIEKAKIQAGDGEAKVVTDTRIVFATAQTSWNRPDRKQYTICVYDKATNKKLKKGEW